MNMTLIDQPKKNYSIHFECIDLIHQMHKQYKSLLAYAKHSYEQDPMVTFFQKVINSMKRLKVSIRVDLAIFGFGKAKCFRGWMKQPKSDCS